MFIHTHTHTHSKAQSSSRASRVSRSPPPLRSPLSLPLQAMPTSANCSWDALNEMIEKNSTIPANWLSLPITATETLSPKRSRIQNQSGTREIQSLPEELIKEILSRLPIGSLFQSRYVCKPWYTLIKSPQMPSMHYSQSSQNEYPTNLILRSIHLDKTNLHYIPDLDNCKEAIHLSKLPFSSWLPKFNVVGSCNGFICLADFSGKRNNPSMIVCNPVVGEWFKLPDPPHFGFIYGIFFGFGYDQKNKEYKVIRKRFDKKDGSSAIEIITVGSDSWRSIEPTPLMKLTNNKLKLGTRFCSQVFLNGRIHWLVFNFPNEVFGILFFDVEKEEFGQVPIPLDLKRDSVPTDPSLAYAVAPLAVLDGCLSVVTEHGEDGLMLRIMNEYGVLDSWVSEVIVLPKPLECGKLEPCRKLWPLAMNKNGSILLQCQCSSFVSYDLKTGKHKKLSVSGLPTHFEAIPHVGTLVTLKDAISSGGSSSDMLSKQ